MAQLKKLTKVGWRGIVVDVPEDWAVASIGGEEHPEYIRIDDPYGASYVEIKWWVRPKPTLLLEDALKRGKRKSNLTYERRKRRHIWRGAIGKPLFSLGEATGKE
ncbi:MAG: hypothetical protein ACPLSK_01340 [bacterium]